MLLAVSVHTGASHRRKAGGENCLGNACECKFGELVHREAFGCQSNATKEPCCTYEFQNKTLNYELFVWTNGFISTSSKSIGIATACLCRYMRCASPLVLRGLYTRFDDSIMSLMWLNNLQYIIAKNTEINFKNILFFISKWKIQPHGYYYFFLPVHVCR